MNPNVKGVVQTMSEQVKLSTATQNAIDNLAGYGIIQKDYKVTKDHEITLISMLNGLVNAIKNGKLKVKQ